jgi:hypothetical protein
MRAQQKCFQFGDLPLPAEEASEGRGQVGLIGGERVRRWEIGLRLLRIAYLEQMLRRAVVLKAVATEVDELKP